MVGGGAAGEAEAGSSDDGPHRAPRGQQWIEKGECEMGERMRRRVSVRWAGGEDEEEGECEMGWGRG